MITNATTIITDRNRKRVVRTLNGVIYISFPVGIDLKPGNVVSLTALSDGSINIKKVAD